MPRIAVGRALISVSDKRGLTRFAEALVDEGVEIVSSGGTAAHLDDAGIPVTRVEDVTGAPEMLGGRVKTLHPRVHGGILADLGEDGHRADLLDHGIEPFQLVVVNLYPFEETIAKPGCDLETAIENIDIGGPTMLRAAAKNHAAVTVIVSSRDYDRVIEEMEKNGLKRGASGLQVYVMAAIPWNVVLAEAFAERFDGFSIGSNDLTQLTLGVDRDSGLLGGFDERNEAVTALMGMAIEACQAAGKPIGICGQGPSDYPDLAAYLIELGIDSISLTPDSLLSTLVAVQALEQSHRDKDMTSSSSPATKP